MIFFVCNAIFFFSFLSISLGYLMNYVICKCHIDYDPIVDKIDELLPQTQCAQCNYPGCRAYANAIVNNNERIDKCIPGGNEVVLRMANVLNNDELKYNNLGSSEDSFYKIVFIDEKNCVGCSKCRLICPVDAIVGSYNFMHTVLSDMCTGCNLCVSLCPTNCIKEKKVFYDCIN
ncbi:RnfABCDGE type electron transport complex subunit B [Buchnera aphidicola]|uniref:RnfABCDGE type electron transport complex subunit B n=1 Tax=Buchnera aphidicola subsp. Melaphis rhois TaxID=118103 RepID=A0A4D6YFJ7_BUCMH|nr:RnfABCDGE type electron transport complex subunit B [Buchnera aphidicola]QCI23145.1 RnfABCDGE type electron transport complex subunit B [Buchnera aphidicola (Melaphis rhois)]